MQHVRSTARNEAGSGNSPSFPVIEVLTLCVLVIAVVIAMFPGAEALVLDLFRGGNRWLEPDSSVATARSPASEFSGMQTAQRLPTRAVVGAESRGQGMIEVVESSALEEAFSQLQREQATHARVARHDSLGSDFLEGDWAELDSVDRVELHGGKTDSQVACSTEDPGNFVPTPRHRTLARPSGPQQGNGILRGKLAGDSFARVLIPHDASRQGLVVTNDTWTINGAWHSTAVDSNPQRGMTTDAQIIRNPQVDVEPQLAGSSVVGDTDVLPFADLPVRISNLPKIDRNQRLASPSRNLNPTPRPDPTAAVRFSALPEQRLPVPGSASSVVQQDQEPTLRLPTSKPKIHSGNDFQPKRTTGR